MAATDGNGRLVGCSNKADIRLFPIIGKQANILIWNLGDMIIGLDVTANGRYVLATFKQHLLLIDKILP